MAVNSQTGVLVPTATYMIGPTGPICRINESSQTEGYYPAGVTSKAPLARGVTRWYVYDGPGSVVGELDDNGDMTTSRRYDVYGAPRSSTLQVAASSGQGYVGSLGHVTDASTGGLIYMQARYYDPGVGRFISQDPSKNGGNWYTYCDGNPSCRTDQNGKDWNDAIWRDAWNDWLFAINYSMEFREGEAVAALGFFTLLTGAETVANFASGTIPTSYDDYKKVSAIIQLTASLEAEPESLFSEALKTVC